MLDFVFISNSPVKVFFIAVVDRDMDDSDMRHKGKTQGLQIKTDVD